MALKSNTHGGLLRMKETNTLHVNLIPTDLQDGLKMSGRNPLPTTILAASLLIAVGLLFKSHPLSRKPAPTTEPITIQGENPVISTLEIPSTLDTLIESTTAEPAVNDNEEQVTQYSSESEELGTVPTEETTPEVMHQVESESTNGPPSANINLALEHTDCTGLDAGTGRILEVRCPPFATGEKPSLKRGETYNFTILFEAGEDSKYLTPEIYGIGILPGIKAPFKGVERNSCKTLTPGCPLTAGQIYNYSVSIKIQNSYPALAFVFQWGLRSVKAKSKTGKNQVCFRMPVEIVAA